MKKYFDFYSFYSVVLFALVDASYQFIWASIGAPRPRPQRILGTRVVAPGNMLVSTYFQSTQQISGDVFPREALFPKKLVL